MFVRPKLSGSRVVVPIRRGPRVAAAVRFELLRSAAAAVVVDARISAADSAANRLISHLPDEGS
jgi:hypothetical protein